MNIRVDLNYPIKDGTEVVFRSPVDCSQVTGLKVYYSDGSQEFAFADAHGNDVGNIDHLFAENVAVKVILDVTTGMAFVQNADTNAYLERRFEELQTVVHDTIVHITSVEDDLIVHKEETNNPHNVTCEQIGAATKEEVEASKAVIVTVSGTTPSHTNEQIFNTVTNGGSVYLKMWSGTYVRLSWCTSTEAFFEASYVGSITGADGNNYGTQAFRTFIISNGSLRQNTATLPEKAYVDAMIQYYLNQ
jgi:RNAse (barnase) inhibitor barstar